jgi:diacylglycerol kinase family enzyme
MKTTKTRVLVLVNPKARGGRLERNWPTRQREILEALGSDVSVEFALTAETERGASHVRSALLNGFQKIVVVGGDGTLSEAIQGFFDQGRIVSPQAVLAVMPAGRGDDFFKTLSQRRFFSERSAWEHGLKLLRKGKALPIDVGRIDWLGSAPQVPRYFVNVASFGFPGLVVQRVHAQEGVLAKSFLGRTAWTYILQGWGALLQYRPIKTQIKVDDEILYQGDVFSGFILNGKFNAGGVCWSSDARLDDGLFHFLLLKPMSWFQQLKVTLKSLLIPWNQLDGVVHTQGKKIEIWVQPECKKSHPFFEIDGETLENADTRGAIVEILPKTICLLS